MGGKKLRNLDKLRKEKRLVLEIWGSGWKEGREGEGKRNLRMDDGDRVCVRACVYVVN